MYDYVIPTSSASMVWVRDPSLVPTLVRGWGLGTRPTRSETSYFVHHVRVILPLDTRGVAELQYLAAPPTHYCFCTEKAASERHAELRNAGPQGLQGPVTSQRVCVLDGCLALQGRLPDGALSAVFASSPILQSTGEGERQHSSLV